MAKAELLASAGSLGGPEEDETGAGGLESKGLGDGVMEVEGLET